MTRKPTKKYKAICSCDRCGIDFIIITTDYLLSEEIGTPELEVACPLCTETANVNDKI